MKNLIYNRLTYFGLMLLLLMPIAAKANNTTISVKAKGSKASGVYAHFRLIVNDLECGTKFTTSVCKEYTFTVPFAVDEIKDVKIVFDNDKYAMGEDRNLFVNCIFIGNEIPIKANKSTAKYVTRSGEEVEFEGMMGWNGTLSFDVASIKSCPGNVTLASQAEVNSFLCQHMVGNLTISGKDIVDLSPLGMLTSVKGALIIRDNPALHSIIGLNSLLEVEFLSIENNPALESIDSFNSLDKCGGMYIRNNKMLKTIKCFHSPDI
jgi:hypothetical protein